MKNVNKKWVIGKCSLKEEGLQEWEQDNSSKFSIANIIVPKNL